MTLKQDAEKIGLNMDYLMSLAMRLFEIVEDERTADALLALQDVLVMMIVERMDDHADECLKKCCAYMVNNLKAIQEAGKQIVH